MYIFIYISYNIFRIRGIYMKQTLKNMFIKDKRVIIRCDFNVPIKGGNVLDDTKIVKSHLGRIKTEEDKKDNSLLPVKNTLENLLNTNIFFAEDILSEETKNKALNLNVPDNVCLHQIIIKEGKKPCLDSNLETAMLKLKNVLKK